MYESLQKEFKKGWDSLSGEQQQQITKDTFPKYDENTCGPSSQVQVYQSQYIPVEHIAAMSLVLQANSYADDSLYDIATDNSDGE